MNPFCKHHTIPVMMHPKLVTWTDKTNPIKPAYHASKMWVCLRCKRKVKR